MKTIKIFCIPSHTFIDRTSGVDFVRIIQPMTYLHGYKDKDVAFEVKVFNHKTDGSFDWRDVFQEYDIVYFNYTTNDMGFAVMGTLAQKYKKKLVVDLDDAIWDIRKDNSAYEIFKEGSWGRMVVTAVCDNVDYVTCTNSYLKNVIMQNTKKTHNKIGVFPNYIDLDFYSHRAIEKNTNNINIGHFGSSTHFQNILNSEFMKALTRIMYEYPNVTFTTIGSFFADFKMKWGHRYNQAFGDADVNIWVKEKFPSFADTIDFFVTPIEKNTYNMSKSATKRWEIASTQRPAIFQNIRQYQEVVKDGVDGYLCTHEHEWYKAMRTLADSHSVRSQVGMASYERLKNEAQMKNHIVEYAKFFKKII